MRQPIKVHFFDKKYDFPYDLNKRCMKRPPGAKHVFLSVAKNLLESGEPNVGKEKSLLGVALSGGFFATLRMTDGPSKFAKAWEEYQLACRRLTR